MPAFGADEVRQDVTRFPDLAFGIDRQLPRLGRHRGQLRLHSFAFVAQLAYQSVYLFAHISPT